MSDQHEPTSARQGTQRKPERVLEHEPDAVSTADDGGSWMDQLRPSTRTRLRNLTLAAIAGMAGVVTLIVVLTALLIGLWIDSRFDQRGPFTFALLCLSIPVSLFLMLRLTLSALNRIQTQPVRTWGRSSPSEEE